MGRILFVGIYLIPAAAIKKFLCRIYFICSPETFVHRLLIARPLWERQQLLAKSLKNVKYIAELINFFMGSDLSYGNWLVTSKLPS